MDRLDNVLKLSEQSKRITAEEKALIREVIAKLKEEQRND